MWLLLIMSHCDAASKAPARPTTAAAAVDSSQRQSKKLSDVKPTVQLSLGNFAPPPSASPAPVAPARPAAAAAPTAASTASKAPAADVGDLLGGMTLDSPAAPSSGEISQTMWQGLTVLSCNHIQQVSSDSNHLGLPIAAGLLSPRRLEVWCEAFP